MWKKCLGFFITGIVLTVTGITGIASLAISGALDSISLRNTIRDSVSIAENTETYVTTIISEVNETEVYEKDEYFNDIDKIDISMSSGYVALIPGEGYSVNSVGVDAYELDVGMTDGTLEVRYTPTTSLSAQPDEKQVFIIVPERVYEKVSVNMTAGQFIANDIITDELKFKISSGSAYFTNITANNSADIEMTSGDSCFSGAINNAGVHVSSGTLVFNGVALTGDNDIKVSSGDAVLDIIGNRSDYMITTSRSSGMISINGTTVGKEYSDASEAAAVNSGSDKINVKVSSGECVITFTAPEYYAEDTENIVTAYYDYSYQE